MGKYQSKEVVVAQNNGQVESHVEEKVNQHSYILISILALLTIIVMFAMRSHFRSAIKRWLRKEIVDLQPPKIVTVAGQVQPQPPAATTSAYI